MVRSCGRIELVDNTIGDAWTVLKTWQTSDDVKTAYWEDGKLSVLTFGLWKGMGGARTPFATSADACLSTYPPQFISGDGTWLTVADDGREEESAQSSRSSLSSAVKVRISCAYVSECRLYVLRSALYVLVVTTSM